MCTEQHLTQRNCSLNGNTLIFCTIFIRKISPHLKSLKTMVNFYPLTWKPDVIYVSILWQFLNWGLNIFESSLYNKHLHLLPVLSAINSIRLLIAFSDSTVNFYIIESFHLFLFLPSLFRKYCFPNISQLRLLWRWRTIKFSINKDNIFRMCGHRLVLIWLRR